MGKMLEFCGFETIVTNKAFALLEQFIVLFRAPDKVRIFISKIPISSPNPMFDHLLESSHRDDSNKLSNIGFGVEITQIESIEVHFYAPYLEL